MDTKYVVSSVYYEFEQEFDSLGDAIKIYKMQLIDDAYDLELKRTDGKEFTEEEENIIWTCMNMY